MKIVFLNRYFHPDHSPTSQLLSDLAFHLASQGREVHVITSRQRYHDPGARLPPQELVRGVTVRRVWTSTFGRGNLWGRALDYLTYYISSFVALLGTVSRGDIVVAKTDPPMLSVVAWPATWLKGARLVNWLQDIFPEIAAAVGMRWAKGPAGRILARLRNSTLRSAAMNVVLGTSMEKRLVSLGMSAGRVRVIHNWADGDSIRPIPGNDNRLRKAWGYADRFVVMYSGNLGRANDFQTIVEAAERLCDDAGIAFLFVGAGQQLMPVQDQAARLRLRNIRFRPYQPHEALGESLCVGDVHLVSLRSELEGLMLPSKFYSIAAAGRPTMFVGQADGEIARLINEFQCGIAVRAGDADGLTTALIKLKNDPELCRKLGENARQVFEQRFEKRRALEAWTEVLNQLPDG